MTRDTTVNRTATSFLQGTGLGPGGSINIQKSFKSSNGISSNNSSTSNLSKTGTPSSPSGSKSAAAEFDESIENGEDTLDTTIDGSDVDKQQRAIDDLLAEGEGGAFSQGNLRATILVSGIDSINNLKDELNSFATRANKGTLSTEELEEFENTIERFNSELAKIGTAANVDLSDAEIETTEINTNEDARDAAREIFGDSEAVGGNSGGGGEPTDVPGAPDGALDTLGGALDVQNNANASLVSAQVRKNDLDDIQKSNQAAQNVAAPAEVAAASVQNLINPGSGVQDGILGGILGGNKGGQLASLDKTKAFQTQNLAQISTLIKTKV